MKWKPFANENGGTVTVNARASISSSNSFTNAGTINGNGALTLNSTFANSGTVAPGASPGILTFNKFSNSLLQIEIAGNGAAGDLMLTLTDLAGKTVFTSQLTDNQSGVETVRLEGVAPGTYFLKVKHPAGERTERVVLQRN